VITATPNIVTCSLRSTAPLLVLIVAFAQGSQAALPARSEFLLREYWGSQRSILAIKQVGDSVLIQSIGPPSPDLAPTGLNPLWSRSLPNSRDSEHDGAGTPNGSGSSLREGSISRSEFRAFWDSLERLGFWRLDNAYRALASRRDEAGGEFSVSFETLDQHTNRKVVRFFAPESCSLEFRQVYALFENMARYAKSVPGWRVLLSYETAEPIEGLKDWYHAEALQAIVVARDSEGLDTLLSMLMHNDERATTAVWGLGSTDRSLAVATLEGLLTRLEAAPLSVGRDSLVLHASKILVQVDSSLAVATLEKLLARLEAAPLSAGRDSLALDASKILVQINARQGVRAVRQYLSAPHDRSLVTDWFTLLAGVGDYSLVPEVVRMLSDTSRYRGASVSKAAMALQQSGYRSRTVMSALSREVERETKGVRRPDWGIVGVLVVALTALTGEEFRYRYPDSPELNWLSVEKWRKWWEANAKRFPVAPRSGLADAYGFIQVNSTPSVAAISLDSLSIGKATPFVMLKVPAGKHELWLTKEGYADWSSSVKVTEGLTATVDAILSPIFGSLRVRSAPSGAAISLDGVDARSRTPHLFAKVLTGRHDLGLAKDRYVGWDSTVIVTQGQTTIARAMLKSPPESLWITYANSRVFTGGIWTGPERAVRFSARSEFGYPLHIAKVSAVFYLWDRWPWPDSSFRFKIYGGNGQTLLYESPVLEAVPGYLDGPAVVHELSKPILVDSGEFYVSVAPIDTGGLPASLSVARPSVQDTPSAIPRSARADLVKRSYTGSPGYWTPYVHGEFAISVLLRH
jgi:hypothetical protein